MSDTSPIWNFLLRARRRRRMPEDSDWVEVHDINSHAVFMGYLAMAVRGLSILLVTWSTVVLLGGFFSQLGVKDFWCVSGITFVQAAGVFDGARSRRLCNIMVSFKGLLSTVATLTRPLRHIKRMDNKPKGFCLRAYILLVVAIMYTQQAMLALTMFPIVAVYVSGPYAPIWLATWRLKHRDYARTSGDDKQSSLKLALDILYVLTVTQGALFYYMTLCSLTGMCLVSKVLGLYKFDKWGRTSVLGYLLETNAGCKGQPSFAGGRNLITYAVDQINSDSAGSITSGVEILGTLLKLQQSSCHGEKWMHLLIGQHMLIKQLVGPVSSGEVMRKLLQMLDSRSPYQKEVRRHAARIVAHLANDVCLEQFPRGIQCVASLLDTFEEYRLLEPYQRDWLLNTYEKDWRRGVARLPELEDDVEKQPNGYMDLVLQALCILRKLAFVPENCKVICNARGLLPKIMAPVIHDILHTIDHEDWFREVVEGSLKVMCQLLDMSPPGETENLQLEVSKNKIAVIAAVERILKCKVCRESVREQSVELLTRLHMDASWGMGTQKRQEFTKMMLEFVCKHCPLESEADVEKTADEAREEGILHFLQSHTSISYKYKLSDDTQEKAGRKVDIGDAAAGALMRLSSQEKSIAAIILKENGSAVNDLTTLLLNVKAKVYRRAAAAIILERLCIDYTVDDAYLKNLKETLTAALPKLLQQIVYYYAPAKKIQKDAEDSQFESQEEEIDEESQSGESKSNCHIKGSHMDVKKEMDTHSDREHIKDDGNFRRFFMPASLSLCVTICDTCITGDQDSACHFNGIASSDNALNSVPRLLKEVVDKFNSTTKKSDETAKKCLPSFLRVTKNNLPTAAEKNSQPTADGLRTLKLISKLVISMTKHRGRYDNGDLDKLMQALHTASGCYTTWPTSILEASNVFTSSDDGTCTIVDSMFNRSMELSTRNLKYLVEEAQELVSKRKAYARV